MKRILGFVAGLVVLCLVVVGAIIGAAFFLTGDVAKAGDDFMQAIKEGRFEDAYAMMDEQAQDQVDLEGFTATWAGLESWSFSNRQVNNDAGQLDGTAVFAGETYNIVLLLQKTGDTWQIDGYDFPQDASTEE